MWIKYMISFGDNVTIAMKSHATDNKVILGGSVKFLEQMHYVRGLYGASKFKITIPATNKIAIKFKSSFVRTLDVIAQLKEEYVVVTKVVKHDRMFR